VVEISTEKELNKLSLKKTVSVVYFGEDPEQIEYFKALALADDTISKPIRYLSLLHSHREVTPQPKLLLNAQEFRLGCHLHRQYPWLS
jgi:hypothetical protein